MAVSASSNMDRPEPRAQHARMQECEGATPSREPRWIALRDVEVVRAMRSAKRWRSVEGHRAHARAHRQIVKSIPFPEDPGDAPGRPFVTPRADAWAPRTQYRFARCSPR